MLALADMKYGMERMWNAVHSKGQDESWLTWHMMLGNGKISIGINSKTY